MKAAEILRKNGSSMSNDCILMVDEMYLKQSSQYHGGEYVGENGDGELYRGIVVFMIVGLKESIPYVIKTCPEVSINGYWLHNEIDSSINNLKECGFNVRAVVCDNHSANVSAFNQLLRDYKAETDLFIYHPAYNGSMKTYLFYDMVHLIKNVRNNMLHAKKFVFPSFKFDQLRDKINVPDGFVSWSLFHQLYEHDLMLQANLKKAHKISCSVLHPGNNKQNVSLALAIFHETTSAAILSYFPDRVDAANFLQLFNKLFLICNSKQRFNNSNALGNAAVSGDKKTEFLLAVADWIETWSLCPHFTLTRQTSKALVISLKSQAFLIRDLLDEGYDYVLTVRFQSDPLERRFSQYRQMNGGNFLVSLREVYSSEKILSLRSMIKEGINIWEEDVFTTINEEEFANFKCELAELSTEILESQLSEESSHVSVTIAGYVAKQLSKKIKCSHCTDKLISKNSDTLHDSYLKLLSRGGLIHPTQSLADFVAQSFSILDLTSDLILKYSSIVPTNMLAEDVLNNYTAGVYFTCDAHKDSGKRMATRIIINIFYNNKRLISTDNVRKQQVKDFKKLKRLKEN
jgi:hypothetical protein